MAAIGFLDVTESRAARAPVPDSRRTETVLMTPSEASAISAEWRALAAEAVEDNHFFLPEVVLPATRHFGEDVQILAVRDGGGALIALAPVTRTRLGRIAPALRV